MLSVPNLFPGKTVACIASGPSLTLEDVEACRGVLPVIAVNDAVRLAPWADVLYACDQKWWVEHPETAEFQGLKYGLRFVSGREDITLVGQGTDDGLSLDPTEICTGKNSGYQAINLAVHFGASKIILLGYDMKLGAGGAVHFFGRHRWNAAPPPFDLFLRLFNTIAEPLEQLGVSVVNCSRATALTMFPRMPLSEALPVPEAVV